MFADNKKARYCFQPPDYVNLSSIMHVFRRSIVYAFLVVIVLNSNISPQAPHVPLKCIVALYMHVLVHYLAHLPFWLRCVKFYTCHIVHDLLFMKCIWYIFQVCLLFAFLLFRIVMIIRFSMKRILYFVLFLSVIWVRRLQEDIFLWTFSQIRTHFMFHYFMELVNVHLSRALAILTSLCRVLHLSYCTWFVIYEMYLIYISVQCQPSKVYSLIIIFIIAEIIKCHQTLSGVFVMHSNHRTLTGDI